MEQEQPTHRDTAPLEPGTDTVPGPTSPEPVAAPPDASPGPSAEVSPAQGDPPKREKLDRDALRALRERRQRSLRRWLTFAMGLFILFLTVAVADAMLTGHYRDLYLEQPWIKIHYQYSRIDAGFVLKVHHEQIYDKLDQTYMNTEVYAIGVVTSVETPHDGGKVKLVLDIPNFVEEVNLYDDDARVIADTAMAAGIEIGDLVEVEAVLDNYSRFGLWLTATSVRRLNAVERWYVRKAMPPESLVRDPIGLEELSRNK